VVLVVEEEIRLVVEMVEMDIVEVVGVGGVREEPQPFQAVRVETAAMDIAA